MPKNICVYHGDPNAMEYSSASKNYMACRKCDQGNKTWYRPTENWGKAWAWREIDRLNEELEIMRERKMDERKVSETIARQRHDLNKALLKIKELEEQVSDIKLKVR